MEDKPQAHDQGFSTRMGGSAAKRRLRLAAAFALAAPFAAPAHSQAPPTTNAESPIIVDGRKLSTKEAIRHLTAAVSVQATGQLARFGDAACPSVAGLPPEYDEVVVDRIKEDATTAGIAIGKPGCRPNIDVLFVDSGQDVVKQIRKLNPSAFGSLSGSEVRRMADDSGPVHAWMTTEIRDEDGAPEGLNAFGGTQLERHGTLHVHTASIINPSTQQAITGAIILLDIKSVLGKTLNQLADYSAMRTLAQTSSKRTSASDDTILALFTPGSSTPPPSLTPFDRAYLTSLYSGSGLRTYFQKVGSIASSVSREAAAPPPRAAGNDPPGH